MRPVLLVITISSALLAVSTSPAWAYCDTILAADVVENVVAGGGSLTDAIRIAKRQGRIDNNDCILEVRGYIIRNSELHPRSSRLIQEGRK